MEGLNLSDLSFDDESLNLFDDDGGEGIQNQITKGEDKEASNIVNIIKPDGDAKKDSQEVVANQSKEKNQVQDNASEDGKGSDSSSPKLNENEQLYSTFAAQLKSKGVLSGLDNIEEVRSIEDIEAAVKAEVESRLTNTQKSIMEAKNAGMELSDVAKKAETIEGLKKFDHQFIEDPKNAEFRMTAIIQDFKEKGYDIERATEMAKRSVAAGTDIDDAKFALKSLIDSEEKDLEKMVEGAKQKESKDLDDIKEYVEKENMIPGLELSKDQRDELYSQITTDLGGRDNAFMKAQKEDPLGSRMKLEALFYVTKGLTDFSVFGQKQETKVTNEIENLLRGANFTESGRIQTTSKDSNSNFTLKDLADFEIE